MSEEETIERILHYLEGAINTYIEGTKVTKVEISVEDDEILLNYISNLQKENEELKETLKCTQDSWFNDTQKLDKLQKELDKKDKVIGLMANQLSIASDRYEYMEETEIIEYFYKKVEEENEIN